MSILDDDFASILARANAAIDARDAAPAGTPPNDPPDDRNARRIRALASAGWESRPLRVAQAPAYDESRSLAYLDALRAVDGSDGGIVVLAGSPGSGKTAASARWAITRPGFGGSPRFLRAAEFFRSSRYQRKEDDDGPPTRDEILRYRALVLDDAGTEYADASGNYRVDLDELIDRFYADARILVITTNIAYASPAMRKRIAAGGSPVDETAPTFSERYGERVADRLRECGRWIDSASPSMRRRNP